MTSIIAPDNQGVGRSLGTVPAIGLVGPQRAMLLGYRQLSARHKPHQYGPDHHRPHQHQPHQQCALYSGCGPDRRESGTVRGHAKLVEKFL